MNAVETEESSQIAARESYRADHRRIIDDVLAEAVNIDYGDFARFRAMI
jgi:hypothetical protein